MRECVCVCVFVHILISISVFVSLLASLWQALSYSFGLMHCCYSKQNVNSEEGVQSFPSTLYCVECVHTHRNTLTQQRVLLAGLLLSGVLHEDGEVLSHVVGRAHDHGDPLVDVHGLDVQNVLGARGGHAPCLHHDVGHGVALVQQPQLQGHWGMGGMND